MRSVNKGMVEVTGTKVNLGAGYGLEIPCKYHFFLDRTYNTLAAYTQHCQGYNDMATGKVVA